MVSKRDAGVNGKVKHKHQSLSIQEKNELQKELDKVQMSGISSDGPGKW